MVDFLERLKQRKLVPWALAYAAFAFALIQGLDVVAHQLGWPERVRGGITLALEMGFFVTLVLACGTEVSRKDMDQLPVGIKGGIKG